MTGVTTDVPVVLEAVSSSVSIMAGPSTQASAQGKSIREIIEEREEELHELEQL
jgi:hypothetical protein